MRKTRTSASTLGLMIIGAALWASSVSAHHSFAMFDATKRYVFTAIVVQVAPNPDHQQLFFVPMNEDRTHILRTKDGKPWMWLLEMEGAAQAAREGITVAEFAPGTIISLALLPLRNGDPGGARGLGASQINASVIFKCPKNTPPAAGKHCDSVPGSKLFGKGTLPKPSGAPALPN